MAGNNTVVTLAKDGTPRVNGRYAPGVSGNPSGRPGGAAHARRMIALATRDGEDLVEFATRALRNEGAPNADGVRERGQGPFTVADQRWAVEWLGDRLWGRPVSMVDLIAHVTSVVEDAGAIDAASVEALATADPRRFALVRDTLARMQAARAALIESEPIDADSTESSEK